MTASTRALLACLAVGVVCTLLSLAVPLRAAGADTAAGRLGAAVFACKSTLDLREVDWIAADDRRDDLPYYSARARSGAVVSVFGPMPALVGGPFMESLEPGSLVWDRELERRARHASALVLGLATTLLAAALVARTTPLRAALLALVPALSFAGVATLGQGLWQQTVEVLLLVAAAATLGNRSWRGGALLTLTPGFLAMAALSRQSTALLVAALGLVWLRAALAKPRWLLLASGAVALVMAAPLLAYNHATTGTLFGLGAYLKSHFAMDVSPGHLAVALLGLAVSPARGLLFYAPALLVALVCALRERSPDERILAGGVLAHVALVAAYHQWWGGWVFGPRMLAEAVWVTPLLVAGGVTSRRAWRTFQAAAAVTIAVGVLGAVRFDLGRWDIPRDPDTHPEALWDLADSPLTAMLAEKRLSTIDAPQGPYAYCSRRALDLVRLAPPGAARPSPD